MVRKHLTTIVFLQAEIKQLIRWNAELILLFNYGCDLNAHRCSWFTSCADSFMTRLHALSMYCKCVKSTDRQFSPLPTHFLKWCCFCYCCNVTWFLLIWLVIINSIKTFRDASAVCLLNSSLQQILHYFLLTAVDYKIQKYEHQKQ